MINTFPIDELQEAWQLASKKHDGQKYGGPENGQQIEYLNHIGSVTFEIISAFHHDKNLDLNLALKCAVLHDTIEDTNLSYNEIASNYGRAIADGVEALTKNAAIESKKDKMLDSLRRIKTQPKEIWAVKMADRIANLYRPPFYWDDTKKREYVEEAKLIHSELGEVHKYLADRLAQKIVAYQRFIS
jgi:(p)ppGpp synthase/HD superfamily hydrolase